jgi:hypothetical protein
LVMACFHPIKNMRNCDPDFATAFNSNFDNKALCESGVMWIIRFVTYDRQKWRTFVAALHANGISVSK